MASPALASNAKPSPTGRVERALMRVLIIGAGGMLGGKLARALAARGALRGAAITAMTLADIAAPAAPEAPCPVDCVALDITDAASTRSLLAKGFDVVFHLAAVVSGHAEAEFDVGMNVNLFGCINVFEAARAAGDAPIVVFTSSIAVYGGPTPAPIPDDQGLNPQTSYGAQKAATELLLTDYSRKGFFDGRGLRLPTISIRPGKANKAASSFMSSIFREPLQGQRAVCPVSPDFEHWYLSPRRCVQNLIHGAEIDGAVLGAQRCFVLPGRCHRIGAMVEAMGRDRRARDGGAHRLDPRPSHRGDRAGLEGAFRPRQGAGAGVRR